MRRRYDTATFSATAKLVRSTIYNAGITTDVIVGFPGEGVREFAESYSFAESIGFSDMHIFPYSIRPGTSAAHLENRIKDSLKREHIGEMLELAASSMKTFRVSALGQTRSVLWNFRKGGDPAGGWNGLTDNYLQVRTQDSADLGNVISNVKLTGLDGDMLTSEII